MATLSSMMPSVQRRRGTRKSGVRGTRLEVKWQELEHRKNKRQSKIEKESVEFSAEVADMWSASMDDMDTTSTMCDDVNEKFDIGAVRTVTMANEVAMLNKPTAFSGAEEEYSDWEFALTCFVGTMDGTLLTELRAVAAKPKKCSESRQTKLGTKERGRSAMS